MKQNKFKTELGEFLAVEMPIASINHVVRQNKYTANLWYENDNNQSYCVCLPLAKYEILGFADQEEMARQVVEYKDYYPNHVSYRNYKVNKWTFGFDNSIESLFSLLKSEGIFTENPLGTNDDTGHNARDREWREAQNNLWQKILLLKKIG